MIAIICGNDSIHHRKVTTYLEEHPGWNCCTAPATARTTTPAERIWAALTNYVANTAVTWPGRLRQIHSFFRNPHPASCWPPPGPRTSPWLSPGYEQNFWNAA